MYIFKKTTDIQAYLQKIKAPYGFIPTMGALHDGHLSLIEECKKKHTIAVCSIFVNPSQFNEKKDLDHYPRPIEEDIIKLTKVGCDVLFLPDIDEVYPKRLSTEVKMDMLGMDNIWEGAFRPGHFKGVVEVVKRFLDIIQPEGLYMGQKDFQQHTIIASMIEQMGLDVNLEVVATARDKNGLALSSRNQLLSEEGKKKAALLYQTMQKTAQQLGKAPIKELLFQATDQLKEAGFKPEYFALVDRKNLTEINNWTNESAGIIITAAWLEDVRLIDNLLV